MHSFSPLSRCRGLGLFWIFLSLGCGGASSDTPVSAIPTVTGVQISNDHLLVSGKNFGAIQQVTLKTESSAQSLSIQSKTDEELSLLATSALTILVGTTYQLIFTTAQAQETVVPISVSFANNAIELSKLSNRTANGDSITNGKVLKFNADTSLWEPGDDVTGSSSSGIADEGISTAKLAAGAVTAAKIADGAVGSTQMADGAITASKIASNAITTNKIQDAAITPSKLDTTAKIIRYDFSFYDNLALNNNSYYGMGTFGADATAAENNFYIVPRAGTLKNFTVRNNDGPDAASVTVSLYKNRTITAQSVSYSVGENTTVKTDSDEVTVVAGDQITIGVTAGGEPGGNQVYAGYLELH